MQHTQVSVEAKVPPTADWVNLDEMASNPYPTYSKLRGLARVVHVPALNQYVITTFAAAAEDKSLVGVYRTGNLSSWVCLGDEFEDEDDDHLDSGDGEEAETGASEDVGADIA